MSTTQPVGVTAGAAPLDIHGINQPGSSQSQQKAHLSDAQLASAVRELNVAMKVINTSLSFSIDTITKQTVVTVTDEQTNEVIRQIPSQEMLKASERIAELLGVLFDHAG